MLYSAFFPFITAFYFLTIGILVGRRKEKDHGHIAFLLLCVTTFIWQFSWALIFSVKDPNIAGYLVKQGYLPILFLPTTMYHFLAMISQEGQKEKTYITLSYSISALFAVLLLTSNLITDGYYRYFFGFYPKAGSLHFLHVMQTIIVALRGLQITYAKQKTVIYGEYKEQLRLCCLSLAIYLLAALDYLCNYGYAFYPPGIIFIGISLTIMAYALIKKNLLNMQWIISRWLSHAVMGIAITLIVIGINITPLPDWCKTSLYGCLCIILAKWGETIRANIQTSAEKKWISDWYDANNLTHELAKALAQSLTPEAIIQTALQTINAHMNFKKAYAIIEKPPHLFISKQPTLLTKNSIAIPIFSSEKIEAILIFDSFISERNFNSADLHCFSTLMAQLDLAMHKAIMQQKMTAELKQKNIHLAEANSKLKDLDKRKNEFLANTSHELRTPLHGIMGFSQFLMKTLAPRISANELESLQLIHQSGTRLNYLINDILDFSKMRENRIELMLTEVNIALLVKNMLVLLMPQMVHQNLVLMNELSDDLPKVLADENRLQQILYNLLGNAIKFTPKGYIQIHAEVETSFLQICITDTGIGIPADKLELVFEAFEQVDGSHARHYGGTGLGLSVTKQLVELHQGHIGVRSSIGEGSCFYFSLPLADTAAVPYRAFYSPHTMQLIESPLPEFIAGQINPQIQQSFQRLQLLPQATVLVVDDDGINIGVTKNLLSSIGARVITANSGKAALSLLKNLTNAQLPNLILLDVMMPGMNGYEVAQQIRIHISATIPIVILTALKEDSGALYQGFAAGANDFLSKPYDETELFMRLESVLHSQDFLKVKEEAEELA